MDEFHARDGHDPARASCSRRPGWSTPAARPSCVLAEGEVTVNGEVETRRGRQLHAGRRGRARRRVRAPDLRRSGHDPRRLRGGLRAGDRQVRGRARRAAAARAPGRAARRLPAGGRRPRARPADRPPAPVGATSLPYEASCGVGYEEVRADEARALEEIVARYRALAAQCDGVLVVGTDFAGAGTASELAFNARVALNLGLPGAAGRSAGTTGRRPEVATAIVGRADDVAALGAATSSASSPTACAPTISTRSRADGDVPVYALPGGRPADGADGRPGRGGVPRRGDRRRRRSCSGREALHLTVAAMTLPNLMERITDGAVLITPGDRADVLLAAMFAHASTALPSPAGVVLTGGLRPPERDPRARSSSFARHAAGRPDRARHLRDGRRWPARARA